MQSLLLSHRPITKFFIWCYSSTLLVYDFDMANPKRTITLAQLPNSISTTTNYGILAASLSSKWSLLIASAVLRPSLVKLTHTGAALCFLPMGMLSTAILDWHTSRSNNLKIWMMSALYPLLTWTLTCECNPPLKSWDPIMRRTPEHTSWICGRPY